MAKRILVILLRLLIKLASLASYSFNITEPKSYFEICFILKVIFVNVLIFNFSYFY
jgi:hypothetical protein